MRETLEYLKKDRRVNDTFIKRLKSVGLEVSYGTYSYWSSQEYLQIGRERVWLVEERYCRDSLSCVYRYQNEVIKDIYSVIREQKEVAEESDRIVETFFEKLELN